VWLIASDYGSRYLILQSLLNDQKNRSVEGIKMMPPNVIRAGTQKNDLFTFVQVLNIMVGGEGYDRRATAFFPV
jgi:hypothetical protein